MNPTDAAPLNDALDALHDGHGWRAGLELVYEHKAQGTVPTLRRHHGPLRTLRGLRPEGPSHWQQIVVHPPGGVASGDALDIRIETREHASVMLNSPGAAKWYRSRAGDVPLEQAGTWATQDLRLRAAAGSTLEWLPMESIIFNGARAQWRTRIEADPGASLIAAELVCLGQAASAQPFDTGCLRWRTDIVRAERTLFTEQGRIDGGSPALSSKPGLAGQPAFGSLYAIAAEQIPAGLSQALRTIDAAGELAITEIGELLIVRWRGAGAQDGWRALRAAWTLLRPALCGRDAIEPRIWAT